jgi:multiple sugar transport system ATP-binding protein
VSGSQVAAEIEGHRLDLSAYRFDTAPNDGTEVVVGLRPEHFGEPGAALADSVGNFELPVQYTEKTGGDATGYLKLGDGLVAVRIDPEKIGQLRQGDSVKVGFPQAKVHVFDAQSGHRL